MTKQEMMAIVYDFTKDGIIFNIAGKTDGR